MKILVFTYLTDFEATIGILYSVVTPYNHSTYYYNELLNSGRQVGDSFYAYVRWGLLLSVGFEGALLYFWLHQMIPLPSAVFGERSFHCRLPL